MDRFGLIQLSDIQFGAKHVFNNPSSISRSIIYDARALASKYDFTPLYLISSGDITESGHPSEFKEAFRELATIAADLSIDKPSMLFVPGNHDVCWAASKIETEIGNPRLRFVNFEAFVERILERKSRLVTRIIPSSLIIDSDYSSCCSIVVRPNDMTIT